MISCKVFGIGLPKTCTMSLYYAMRQLGLNETQAKHYFSLHEYNTTLSQYTFCNDLPISFVYTHLMIRFPDAKFIYTTRNVAAWTASIMSHIKQTMHLNNHKDWGYYKNRYLLGNCQEPDDYRLLYESHQQTIIQNFSQCPERLLNMDIEAGDGWDKLCNFLQVDVKTTPFPFSNRNGATFITSYS